MTKPRRATFRAGETRVRVAEEAARIMREQGVRDFLLAKRKAADRLGVVDRQSLPANQEIADALAAQQRLFGGAAHEQNLHDLRQAALRAMGLLKAYKPRLVGPILAGTATAHTDVSLHLFAPTPEEVAFMLLERGIRYRTADRRVRLTQSEYSSYPAFEFEAGGVTVEAIVFPEHGLRQAPLCPVTGAPMRRGRADEIEAMLAEDAS